MMTQQPRFSRFSEHEEDLQIGGCLEYVGGGTEGHLFEPCFFGLFFRASLFIQFGDNQGKTVGRVRDKRLVSRGLISLIGLFLRTNRALFHKRKQPIC